jgi:predicted transcriptional regulator
MLMHKTNGIQLDEDVQQRIEQLAQTTGVSAADIIRAAIERYACEEEWSEGWLAKAERLGLIGCSEGGPADLSTNKAYFEGFGRG